MGLSVIDLFCGAGGLSAGMEAAGAEIIAGFDNDRDSLKTFQFNHKGSKAIHADLSEPLPDIKNFKGIDLVVGGPPCQGFPSLANVIQRMHAIISTKYMSKHYSN